MVAVAGIPAFFLRTGSDPFNVPKLSLLVIGLSLAIALRSMEVLQGSSLRFPGGVWVPALAIAIPLTLAWLFSPYRGWALFGQFPRFQGWLPTVLIVLLGVLIADAFRDDAQPVAWALVVGGTVVGAYAVVQVLGMDPFEWQLGTTLANQTLSTLGNPNFTGGFLGITLPITAGLWLQRPDRRSLLWKVGALMTIGWIAARSEGGWIAGLAGLVVVGGFALVHRRRAFAWLGLGVTAAMALSISAVALFGAIRPNGPIPFTLQERGQWWIAAAKMGGESPLIGRGPNTFALEGVQFRTPEEALQQRLDYTDDPHSVPLSIFSGAGTLGVLGLVVLMVWVVSRAREIGSVEDQRVLFLAAVVAFFVQSVVSIDEPSLRIALWSSLGGLAATGLTRPQAPNKPGKKKSARLRGGVPRDPIRALPALLLIFLVAVASIAWALGFLLADHRFREGRALLQAGFLEEGAAEIDRALSFREETVYRHLLGFDLGEAALELGSTSEAQEVIRQMSRAFAYLDEIPDVPALRDYARLLHSWGGTNDAIEESLVVYLRAIRLDSFNPILRIEAADVAVEAERFEAVPGIVEPILGSLGDDFPSLFVALAQAQAATGNWEEASGNFERAIEIEPSNGRFIARAVEAAAEARDFKQVVEWAEPVAGSITDLPSIWGTLALARVKLGDFDGARIAIDRALAEDSDEPHALEARHLLRQR